MRNFHVTRILQPKLGLELLDKSDCLAVLLIGTENRFFIGFFLNKSAIRQFVKKKLYFIDELSKKDFNSLYILYELH